MEKGVLPILFSLLLWALAPVQGFARACEYADDKFQEWASMDEGKIQSSCDKNIGAEADKIEIGDRAARMSACVYAYRVANSEAKKYLDLRTKNCAAIVNKSQSNPDSCASDGGSSSNQRVCLEKVAANLREAAAMEEELKNAMKLAQVSADAAVKYTIKAIDVLAETEGKIVEAVEKEMSKVVDPMEKQKAESIIRNANAIQGGQLAFSSAGEVRADQAGPGVSTISGFKEKVPVMIQQQEEAASLAKNFSERSKTLATYHGDNAAKYRSLAEETARRASGISTAGTNKSEDDSIPIPKPRPKPENLNKIDQARGSAGSGPESSLSKSSPADPDSKQATSGGPKDLSETETSVAEGNPGSKGSGALSNVGSLGAAGAAGAAAANSARPKPGLSSQEWDTNLFPSASDVLQPVSKSTNLAGVVGDKVKPGTQAIVEDPNAAKPLGSTETEKVGAGVVIQGAEKGSALSGSLAQGQSRLVSGSVGGGVRASSTAFNQRSSFASKSKDQPQDPTTKNFQTNLSEGGVPVASSDIRSTFEELASDLGIDSSAGLTAEESAAFSSLQNSGSEGGRTIAEENKEHSTHQFDASVQGTEGKALFLRTRYAHIRALKKGLLIQNVNSKL